VRRQVRLSLVLDPVVMAFNMRGPLFPTQPFNAPLDTWNVAPPPPPPTHNCNRKRGGVLHIEEGYIWRKIRGATPSIFIHKFFCLYFYDSMYATGAKDWQNYRPMVNGFFSGSNTGL
jgi:hypothetical protein